MSTPDAIKKVHKEMDRVMEILDDLDDAVREDGDILTRLGSPIEKKVEALLELRTELLDVHQLDDLKWYVETFMNADDVLPALEDLAEDTPVTSATNRGSNGRAMLEFTTREMFDLLDALGLPTNTPPSRVKEALLEGLKP